MSELVSIFSTGIQKSDLYNLSEEELNFIKGLETRKNISNSYSSDLKVLNNEQLKNLKDFCQQEIDNYLHKVLNIKDSIEIFITQSWVNFSQQGEQHHLHNHPNSILSGVYFIEGEVGNPIVFRNSGFTNNICGKFTDLPVEYNTLNSPRWWMPNINGQLLVFPSELDHLVEVNNSDKTRISLSFNTFIRGDLGSDDDLSDLTLS